MLVYILFSAVLALAQDGKDARCKAENPYYGDYVRCLNKEEPKKPSKFLKGLGTVLKGAGEGLQQSSTATTNCIVSKDPAGGTVYCN